MPIYQFVIFSKKKQILQDFISKNSVFVDRYWYLNNKKTCIKIDTLLSKNDLKEKIKNTVILETAIPCINDLLDKILSENKLTPREKQILNQIR